MTHEQATALDYLIRRLDLLPVPFSAGQEEALQPGVWYSVPKATDRLRQLQRFRPWHDQATLLEALRLCPPRKGQWHISPDGQQFMKTAT